ncbi:SgcJ/EcaC family oxidoreductase [Rugamonas sp. A1-17]|nr:SgcJ/EcaC family oxidoreductase [Rugamonas sp. A1-17]
MRTFHILPSICLALLAHTQAASAACQTTSEQDITALFDQWNAALKSGRPERVATKYARRSVLLVPGSTQALLAPAEKLAYFKRFLERRPTVHIDTRVIAIDCDMAIDAGTYTFSFADGSRLSTGYSFTYQRSGGRWRIVSHRASELTVKG